MNDPWKHRGLKMTCKTCMWYVKKETFNVASADNPVPEVIGRCRRHAPTMSGYPVVYETDWCGDHKLDETKV